ncbi:MAG: sensor histidine kinase [Paenibacillaceae bacterium]|nr:sensor histidine kinase [Paenibacillaceae bacterium]
MNQRPVPLTRFLMLFSLLTVSVLLLIVCAVLYFKTKSFIDQKVNDLLEIKLSQTTADTKKQFEDVYQALEGLRGNEPFLGTIGRLAGSAASSYERVTLSLDVEAALFNFKKDNDFIARIDVVTTSAQYGTDRPLFAYPLDKRLPDLFRPMRQIRLVPEGGTYAALGLARADVTEPQLRDNLDRLNQAVYLAGSIPSFGSGGGYGMIIIQIAPDNLKHRIPYDEAIAIVAGGGNVLYRGAGVAADVAPLQAPAAWTKGKWWKGKRYYTRDIGFSDLYLVFAESSGNVLRPQLPTIGAFFAAALLGCALLSFVLATLLRDQMLRPLHGLIRSMGRYHQLRDRWRQPADANSKRSRVTMRDRLFFYFTATILLPIILFVALVFRHSTQIISQELQRTYEATFEKTVHRIELFVEQKKIVLARLAYDSGVIRFVNRPEDAEPFAPIMMALRSSPLGQDTVAIYTADNRLLYASRNPWNNRLPEPFYLLMHTERRSLFYYAQAGSGSTAISLGMAIVELNRTAATPVGFLAVDVEEVYWSNLYASLESYGGTSFIADENGRILSHPDPEKIGSTAPLPLPVSQLNGYASGGETALYFAGRIGDLPWYLVSRYDYTAMRGQAEAIIYDDIYLMIIVLLLAMLFAYGLSQYLLSPFAAMNARFFLQRPDGTIGPIREESYAIDEVGQLQTAFNRMLERIEQLAGERVLADRRQMVLQIDALQAQINPHFLHNTLENIMYAIEEGDGDGAVEMIGLLSRLFRFAMGKDNPLTTLREELDYAEAYADIMGFRFGDRIVFVWEEDAALNNCTVVKMLLQPLIENAIRHNEQTEGQTLRIVVSCRREDDMLLLQVADNGSGIAEERLRALQAELTQESGVRGHVGLYNVHSRIRLHFGRPYGLAVDSAAGEGTSVVLRLPYLRESAEDFANES